MIIIKNRELMIPGNERFIGTPLDNETDIRQFRMDRFSQNGFDLSNLTFRLDMKYPETRKVYTFSATTSRSGRSVVVMTQHYTAAYPNAGTKTFTFNGTKWNDGSQDVDFAKIGVSIAFTPNNGDTITVVTTTANVDTDTVLLTKEIHDDYFVLTWEITANQTAVPGTVFANLRGSDENGDQRYASFPGVFYSEKNIYSPANYGGNLSELEQLENQLVSALRRAEYLSQDYEDLEEAVEDAEAWANGTRGGVAVDSGDQAYHNNSKYYRMYAERFAKGTENGAAVSSGDGYLDNAHYWKQQGERYAVGKEDGTDVASGTGYHDNSKYYKELADDHRKTAEAYAKGTVNGTAVTSGQTGYQDNAKYYKEQVQSRLNQIDTNTSNIAVQTARIDNIASLPSGSTSGDAELMDIRVGADGVTYTSAGAAVRANDSLLKSQLEDKCKTYINLFDPKHLLAAEGWTQTETEYVGTAYSLAQRYKDASSAYPISSFSPLTQYKVEFDAKTDGSAGNTGSGLRFTIEYTDGTIERAAALNSYNQYTHVAFVTNANKSVRCVYLGYGSYGYNVWHIKNIMIAKTGTEYNYLPYLIPADFYSRDKIAETNANVAAIKNDIKRLGGGLNKAVLLTTPEGFAWQNHPLAGKVRTDYNGNYYFDFDVADYDVSGYGVTYYVDNVNGREDNSGLSATSPLRKMATAYNKSDCSCIMLFDGIYNNGGNLNATTITKDIAIKAMPGANPVVCASGGSTFSVYSGNTYSATRGSCVRVIDTTFSNAYGDFYEYVKKETVAEVVESAGTWAYINGILYVHCIDGREPDNALLLCVATNNLYIEGNPTVYLEGLTVISGLSPLKASNTISGTNPKVYAKNCRFLYSETVNNDVVMLQGTEISVFQNCKALYGMKDGFNYHAKNGTVPKAIEINCIGAMCGNAEDSNDQGSTIHDGGSAIRINCMYFRNIGSNVADEASESWNVGCVAYEPLAPNSGQRGNFYALTGTKMWIDSCRGFGNPHYNVLSATDDTTEVHLRNNIFDNADKSTSIYGVTPIYY